MLKHHETQYLIETKDRKKFDFSTGRWYFESAYARPEDDPPYGNDCDVLVVSWRGREKEFLSEPEKQNYAVTLWSFRL